MLTAPTGQDGPWHSPEDLATSAARLLADQGPAGLGRFDDYPGPLYAVDPAGRVSYFNRACTTLAGRTPQLGIDLWCVGLALPSDSGAPTDPVIEPMADAVREARSVRGIEAVFERPDGERIRVRPYPTPALDEDGIVCGAINLMVPLDGTLHDGLLATTQRCRTLAKWVGDRSASESLLAMAAECEAQAKVLRPS